MQPPHNKRAQRAALKPTPQAKSNARALRANLSLPERLLWPHLRGARLGQRVRRQHPIGPYIADFYAHDARLVIEIDGGSHAGINKAYDAERDTWMRSNGLRVLRIPASEVLGNLEGVVGTIRRELTVTEDPLRPASRPTSPAGAGEEPPNAT